MRFWSHSFHEQLLQISSPVTHLTTCYGRNRKGRAQILVSAFFFFDARWQPFALCAVITLHAWSSHWTNHQLVKCELSLHPVSGESMIKILLKKPSFSSPYQVSYWMRFASRSRLDFLKLSPTYIKSYIQNTDDYLLWKSFSFAVRMGESHLIFWTASTL